MNKVHHASEDLVIVAEDISVLAALLCGLPVLSTHYEVVNLKPL